MVAYYMFLVVAQWTRLVKRQRSWWRRWLAGVPLLGLLAPIFILAGALLWPFEWLAFHVPAWLMPKIRPAAETHLAISKLADHWKSFMAWMLALTVPAYLFTFVIPLSGPQGLVPLGLSLTAFFLVAGINYRKAALGAWYRPVATTDTGHVATETFIPGVNPATPAKEARERLQRYPFLTGLSYLSALLVLFIFVPLFASLHLAFGFYPDGAGRPVTDWMLFTLDSSSKALLDVVEVFDLGFSPIHAGSSFGEHLAVLLKRIVTDLLVIQVLFGLILRRRDDIGDEAADIAAEAWEGNEAALVKASGLGDAGAEAFLSHAQEVGKSVRSWCEVPDHRAMICDAAIGAWAQEGADDVTELEFGRRSRFRYGSLITDRGLSYLANFKGLRQLELVNCRQLGPNALAPLRALTQLESIDLTGCAQLPGAALQPLMTLRNLRRVVLAGCEHIDDEGFTYLRMIRLTVLDVAEHVNLLPASLNTIGGIRTLQRLNLQRCKKLRDSALDNLRGLSNLLWLNLSDCEWLSDDGLAHLTALKNLRELHLANTGKFSDDGLRSIAKIRSLQVLDLQGAVAISSAGIAHLATLSGLTRLSLNSCAALTDAATPPLSALTHLAHLDLGNCRALTAAALTPLPALPALESLNLRECLSLGDEAVDTLAACVKLKSLDLSATKLSAEAKDRIVAALPDCAVRK